MGELASSDFTQSERLAAIRLIRSEHVGPVTYRQLLARFGSARRALEALPDLARRGGGRPPRLGSLQDAEAELAAAARQGVAVLCLGEPAYPPSLATLEDAPPVLFLRGRAELLRRRAVALVGARNASGNGRRFAEQLAQGLARAGLVVVSGLARGIDAAAHEGALAAAGGTVAVVAGGADVVYPPEHAALTARIAEQGAVLAEMPLGTLPQARHFPRRNRLISGLARAVVVVEAAPRSGSLITARFAAEQGREVLAVPGSPLDPRAQGSNQLIREGATLVQSVDDILEALGPAERLPLAEPAAPFQGAATAADAGEDQLEPARRAVLELLSPVPLAVDEVIRRCQLSPSLVQTVLLELELAGRVERHPGHRVALVV